MVLQICFQTGFLLCPIYKPSRSPAQLRSTRGTVRCGSNLAAPEWQGLVHAAEAIYFIPMSRSVSSGSRRKARRDLKLARWARLGGAGRGWRDSVSACSLSAVLVLTHTAVVVERAEDPIAAPLHVIGGADAAEDGRFPHLFPGLEAALPAGTMAKQPSNDTTRYNLVASCEWS